jgi:acyl transferase domain-containing protein
LVPSLDTIIIQYIQEGLGSFARGSFFSAAVMIGAASEKEIYLLAGSLVGALKDPAAQAKLTKQVNTGRSLYQLLEMIRKHIDACHKLRGDFDGALAHLSSLFETIRVQRNDAVHPSTGTVNEASVRLSYKVFPHAVEKAEKLRAWFGTNPNSV